MVSRNDIILLLNINPYISRSVAVRVLKVLTRVEVRDHIYLLG
jgi:hypothetical protein